MESSPIDNSESLNEDSRLIESLKVKSNYPNAGLETPVEYIPEISGKTSSPNASTIGQSILHSVGVISEQNKSCSSHADVITASSAPGSKETETVTEPEANGAQSDKSSTVQIGIDCTAACAIQNDSNNLTPVQCKSQSEIGTEQNVDITTENTHILELPEKASQSQTDSIATANSNQNEFGTDDDRSQTGVTNQVSTGKVMKIEQNVANNKAQTASFSDAATTSHSNQNESASTQSLTSKEMETVPNEASKTAQSISTPDHQVPSVPSCSISSDKTIQENDTSVISKMTPNVDNSVPSTSKSTSETSRKFESCDMFDIGAKKDIDEFQMSKVVNIYAEDKGPKFYDVRDSFVSKPIILPKLSEAFSALPIFGRPKKRAELPQFQDNKIKEFVGCGMEDSEFQQLAEYCSPYNLRTGNELTMPGSPGQGFYPTEMERLTKNTENFTSHHDLSIVRKHKLRVEKDTKNLYPKRHKYRGIRMMSLGNDEDDNTPVVTIGTPVTPGKDLLIFIRWYRPFAYNPKDKNQYRTRHSVFSCNTVMLGRQSLSLLRDRVVCPNDVDMRVDVSERPDELPRTTSKEMFPSGFMFINNVFYVDSRAGCADHSAPLRRWAAAKGLGDFPRRDMGDVSMDQLPCRLGHPEVYVHQGNCEHLFTISEIRLVTASDPLKLSAYPCHTALSQNQTVYCTTCAEFGAKWIVVGCSRVPFDPAFFCEKCFKLYLYKDGKKIGDFKAYLYRGNEINVLKPQG